MRIHCENCGTPLNGGFCSQCGQSGKDFNLPVGEFARDFASETLSLDSRLKITLQQLFLRPGRVPKEYAEGHRARFVPPVRLYVFASFLMFFVGSFAPEPTATFTASSTETASVQDSIASTTGPLDDADVVVGESNASLAKLGERLGEGVRRFNDDPQAGLESIRGRMPQAMFFLLPAFAVLLKLVHRRRLFMHHLIFAIYLHCFVFVVLAAISLPEIFRLDAVSRVADLGVLWVPPYVYLGMRRFYGESRGRTFLKLAFVSIAYFVLGILSLGALFLLALLTI